MATYGPSFNTHSELSQYSDQGNPLRFIRVGEWDKAQKVLDFLASKGNTGVKQAIAQGQRQFAEKLKTAIVRGVRSEGGSLGQTWQPHSEGYKKWARSKGFYNTGLLRLSNNYIRALENMKVVQKGYTTRLRLSSSDLYKRSHKKGLVMSQYAVLLEVGSLNAKITERPLWGPAFQSVGGANGLRDMVHQVISKKLNKF